MGVRRASIGCVIAAAAACTSGMDPGALPDAAGSGAEVATVDDVGAPADVVALDAAPAVDRPEPLDVAPEPDVPLVDLAPAVDLAPPMDRVELPDAGAPVDGPLTDRADAATDAPTADAPTADAPVASECGRYPFSSASLLAERVGFGAGATGGNSSRIYHVTTLSGGSSGSGSSGSLRRALESAEPWWIVFDVSGTITWEERVRALSNKTVDGRGRDVLIRGHLDLHDARNIILSDLRMTNDLEGHCTQAGDVITLTGTGSTDPAAFTTRDIWLHHLELFNGGDGLLDIRGASRVTVSWVHFHTHKKGLLLWQDGDHRPTPGMHLTMHHNFFDRISLRGPQLVYGRMHYFNNYQFQWFYYGAGSLGGAQLYSENNVYEARNACIPFCQDPNPCGDMEWFSDMTRALVTDWDTNGTGNTRSSGDLLRNGARLSIVNPTGVFDPRASYAYTADPATDALAARVRAEAGPRPRYCAGP